MKWNTEITNKGAELIAQAVVSGDIVFTRSVGSSTLSGVTDLKTVTEISEPQYNLGLKSIETNGKSVRITVRLLNDGVDEPYTIKQVGIYGKLKDETDEVLISVSESSTGETVPSTATVPEWVCDLVIVLNMENSISPTIVISSGIYANIDHKHSKDDIEDLPEISGENLLDNPDFKINQRGLGQYSCNSTKFCVDRWYTFKQNVSTAGTITINENGLKLKSGGTRLDTYLAQTISNKNALVGKTVTLSFEISEIVGSFMVGRYGDNSSIKTVSTSGIIQHTFSWLPSSDTMPDRILFYNNSADFSCIIKWVKLEVGSIATPFISPNPTEELLKIQSMDNSGGVKIASNDTLPTIMNSEMVSNPNLLVNPDFKINQRGLHSYSTLGNGVAVPFSDGWFIYPVANDVTSRVYVDIDDESSIHYEWDSGDSLKYKAIYQRIVPTNFNLRIGEPLIASAKISSSTVNVKIDVVIYSDFMEPNYIISTPVTTYNNSQNGIIISTISEIPRGAKLLEFRITTVSSVSESGNFKVAWAKLEYGSVPTKFVAPNYAEELLKIQSMNDDGSTKLISNEMLPSIMNSQMVSNPNLLDNPDFRINQRGQSEYTVDGYGVDRWHIHNTAKLTVNDGYITYENTTNNATPPIYQNIGNASEFAGKTVTITFDCDILTGGAITIQVLCDGVWYPSASAASFSQTGRSLKSITVTLPDSVSILRPALVLHPTTEVPIMKVNIYSAKLELGGVSTPFIAPNYTDELIKIQSMKDDGTPKLVSNGALPTIMNSEMVSNPNLLDNPDFRINQRGLSVYSQSAKGQKMTIDRWAIHKHSSTKTGDVTLTPSSSGGSVLNNQTDGTACMYQRIENFSDLFGKQITYSASINGSVLSLTATCTNATAQSGNVVYTKDKSAWLRIWVALDTYIQFEIYLKAGASITVDWVKLEMGDTPTPFIPPNPALELEKCQRYLWVVRSNAIRLGSFAALSSTGIVYYLYLPIELRTVPTITFENMTLYGTNSASVTASISSITVRGRNSNNVKLYVTTGTNMTTGALYELANISGSVGMIELSSEI